MRVVLRLISTDDCCHCLNTLRILSVIFTLTTTGGYIVKLINSALLGTAVLFSVPVCADAADIYGNGGVILEDEVPYAARGLWDGLYAGGHVGATFDSTFENEQGDQQELDNGANVGVHVGYNWETQSNWILGVEADFGIADDEARGVGITDYIATLRGRLGYANGSSLLYATAGAALANYDEDIAALTGFNDNGLGYVLGVGWNHKLLNNLGVGFEGLYYDVTADGLQDGGDINQQFFIIRARMSYFLNRDGYEEPLK